MRNNKGGLGDLKRLQQSLQRARAESERAAREVAARAAELDPDAFRKATQAVTPIKPTGRRAPTSGATPVITISAGTAVRKPLDESVALRRAAAMGETATRADAGLSDGAEVAHLLSEGGTAFVRADAAPDTARNLRRGQWPAGAELDLHGLRVEQARHAVVSFLDECLEHGIRSVRIVHGKGYGSQGLEPVLKDKVRTWLVQKTEVMAFSQAAEREGGAGALLVLLRQTGARRA